MQINQKYQTLKKLIKRFISDYSLPMHELEFDIFLYLIAKYEEYNQAYSKFEDLIRLIKRNYNNNENLFLEDYYRVRNDIITSIEESESFKEFSKNTERLDNQPDSDFSQLSKSSVYLEKNDGKRFISIDLKEANFQALKYYNNDIVNRCDNYADFIKFHIGESHPLYQYYVDSKYTRQVIFGKLNMSKNVKVQKHIMSNLVYNKLKGYMSYGKWLKYYSHQTDEIIIEVLDSVDTNVILNNILYGINSHINTNSKYDVKFNISPFTLKLKKYQKYSYGELKVFLKEYENGKFEIKGCPSTYFPQVYTLLIGDEIKDEDMYFTHDGELAKFQHPLTEIK